MMMRPARKFTPPVDVLEMEDRLIVQVEIAGMRHSDFHIELLNHTLVISGTRQQPERSPIAYHQVEIGYGRFRLEVALPWEVESEKVSATYAGGFLEVDLPRKAAKDIPVTDLEAQQQ